VSKGQLDLTPQPPLCLRRGGILFALLFLGGAALLLYLSFQSISLDDFDSVSFALALDHFDIALQQPHPPGFPVYVAAGRVVRLFTGDPRIALTFLSAISGSAAVLALAWLGKESGQPRAGLIAALWLTLLPVFWLTSEMVLSDIPGLALVLLVVLCLWKGRRDGRWLAVGSGLAGLCLGLRPQNAVPVALFGVDAVIAALRSRQNAWRSISLALLTGLLAVLLWLIPTANASGGWAAYQSLVSAHSRHVLEIDSLFGRPIDGTALSARFGAFLGGTMALFGGMSDQPVLALLTLAIIGFGLLRVGWRTALVRLCWLWLLITVIQVFLLESLERPRLYLPFVPPLLLLSALGWTGEPHPPTPSPQAERGKRWGEVNRVVPLLLPVAFLLTGLPLAATLSLEPTPPMQATQYIAAHYPADQTVIVSLGSFRAAQIGLPGYPQLYLGQFDAPAWKATLTARQPTYLIMLDRDDVWPEAYATLTESGAYVPIEDHVFSRDPRVFPQHSLVRMQVLTPLRLLSPAQLAPPASGEIRTGDETNGRYFGEGWYRVEDVAGSAARWAQQSAVIRVALPPVDTTLTLEAAPYPTDQAVLISVNGQRIGTLALRGTWEPVTLSIPASALASHPISTITLTHTHAQTPPGSDRALAAAYRVIRFTH
jgi:hypothetical protein